MIDASIFPGLFFSALLSSTLLPGTSEVALLAAAAQQPDSRLVLFLAATLGNTLGSVINYALGRSLAIFEGQRWFPFRREQIARASRHYQRFGSWSLLLAWLPVFGDPLTLMAGVLRVPFLLFVILVGAGKAARYAALLAGFSFLT